MLLQMLFTTSLFLVSPAQLFLHPIAYILAPSDPLNLSIFDPSTCAFRFACSVAAFVSIRPCHVNLTALANQRRVFWAQKCCKFSQSFCDCQFLIFSSPSLSRTIGITSKNPDSTVLESLSGGVTTASDVDSAGDSFEANAYKDSPAIAGEDGDESHIEWSVSPPPRAPLPLESLSGEPCASDEDGEISHRRSVSPISSPKELVPVSDDRLYSNRLRMGTPEQHRPSSPRSYSPIDISDDDFPVLPSSETHAIESPKPFVRSKRILGKARRTGSILAVPNSSPPTARSVGIDAAPPQDLASIVINGRTYYASDDPLFKKIVSPPTLGLEDSADESISGSLDLCYPPEDVPDPASAPPRPLHGASEDYDDMDIDLPEDFRSVPALRTPSPDLPANPMDGWSPTKSAAASSGGKPHVQRVPFPKTPNSTRVFPSKSARSASPLKGSFGVSPSPQRSSTSSPSHSVSGISTANTSPSKNSTHGSVSLRSKGSESNRFHPFNRSTRTDSSSIVIPGSRPTKFPSRPSAVGKKYRDDIINQALSNVASPPPHSSGNNKRKSSLPRCKARNDCVGSVGEGGDDLHSKSPHEDDSHDSAPFIDNNLGDGGALKADWIDARFAASFKNVVNLPTATIRPVADEALTEDDDYLLYHDMVSGIPLAEERCIRRTMNFVRAANVFNGSRFDPTSTPLAIACPTINQKLHLVLAEDKFFNAVFLTVGCVVESYLLTPKSFLSRDKSLRYIRGLRVHGLMQEAQRLFACFGSLIGTTKFGCPVSEGIIDFRSNQRFDSDINKDDPDDLAPLELVSPGKKRDVSNIPKNLYYKDPLPFSRAVPIFDGRESFIASSAQLNHIGSRTYPLYKGSQEDVPPGYCAPPLSLSLGIQFVVLLALPPGTDAPAPAASFPLRPPPVPTYTTPPRTNATSSRPNSTSFWSGVPSLRSHSTSKNMATSSTSRTSAHRSQFDQEDGDMYDSSGELGSGYEYLEDIMPSK
ncbi:MAG: hypothetical protein NXY57DRAFT_957834 [Lentinula lateritia]|nr:MAG: hypothetical protein NXY57DRAFT_957834 [Lentinula lateritia]